jgi:hypothetical protein
MRRLGHTPALLETLRDRALIGAAAARTALRMFGRLIKLNHGINRHCGNQIMPTLYAGAKARSTETLYRNKHPALYWKIDAD